MGDPLNEQAETQAALRQVVEAAGPYLERLPRRLVSGCDRPRNARMKQTAAIR